jgi:hypothetical protein
LDKPRVDDTFIAVDPVQTIDEAAMLAEAEKRAGGEGFVTYTFPVPELDPLAVLETLNEPAPRGYFENPSRKRAPRRGLAGPPMGPAAATLASSRPTAGSAKPMRA